MAQVQVTVPFAWNAKQYVASTDHSFPSLPQLHRASYELVIVKYTQPKNASSAAKANVIIHFIIRC